MFEFTNPLVYFEGEKVMGSNTCPNGSGTSNTCENGSGDSNTCPNGSGDAQAF